VYLGNFSGWPFDATTAAVLQQFHFTYHRGADQGTGKFYLFVKKNLNVGGGLLKKMRRKVVQRWLYPWRLNWHRSAIFQRQYDFSSATWDQLFASSQTSASDR
jgi:hypothetical protein